ncbi:MAG: HAD family hydrolase [Candidatus Kryptoniota bacterium]
MINKSSLVIFDLDGTLVDTHQLIFDSFNFVMRKYKSIELTPKEIMSYFGPPEDVCIKNMIGAANFDDAWQDYLEYCATHIRETVVFSGIPELLNRLKKSGSHLGVFTGKGSDTTDMTLEYHGLKNLFDVIVTGSNVTNHKPHPEGIEFVLRQFNVEPGKAILIGDSLSDYKAAASARTHFIAALYDGFMPKDRFDGTECVKVNSVQELSEMLLPNGFDSVE